ncbi:tenascin-R-like [Cochliomyia hominivorax]
MHLNSFVLNLVILIFITGIKCNNNLQPEWLNGEPIFHSDVNITSSSHHRQDYAYYALVANLQDIRKSLYDLNLKLHNHVFQCCRKPAAQTIPEFDVRYDTLPIECTQAFDYPTNCAEATACTHASGIYSILQRKFSDHPFLVWCDVVSHGGGWTVIQRRHDGSEDFERVWSDYVNGFGNPEGEFFIGLDILHVMTNFNGPQELLIIMRDTNETKYAKYDNFVVGGKKDFYTLFHLGAYSGDAGDSLRNQLKQKFTTKDRDNDKAPDYNCAQHYTGAWWHNYCHESNLNGKYGDNTVGRGINWLTFRGWQHSIPYVTMMIRRRTY